MPLVHSPKAAHRVCGIITVSVDIVCTIGGSRMCVGGPRVPLVLVPPVIVERLTNGYQHALHYIFSTYALPTGDSVVVA